MNSTRPVFETSSTVNVKEEIDADSVEKVIKVEGEGEEVKVECEDIEVDLKVEDEEKPTVCQCEECGSGGRERVDWCTRAIAGYSSQAIKKEELEGDDEQSADETRRGKKAKRNEMVKEEVKKEEDEISMAGPLTQRYGSASADSVIIKFEDNEEVTCPCEDCGMVKREERGEEVKAEEEGIEVAIEVGGSSDDETVIEDENEDKDCLASTESSEETNDGSIELVQEPIEMESSTAPPEVRPVAGTDIEQARNARGRKLYRCHQCQKMVTTLTRHLLTHTDERPHICDQCGRTFTQKSHLNRHLKAHTMTFSCQQCGKCFALKESLTVHLKRHNGEKAYQCDQCPSAFVTRGQRTTHRRHKHTGERPFACHIANCNKAFADKSNLSTHLKFHSGEKRHRCEDCEMQFVTNSELTRHRRRKHIGEKRHQCEDCEMRFVTKGELTRHRHYKHSTERPFCCTHSGCNYASALKDNLNRHLNSNKHRQ